MIALPRKRSALESWRGRTRWFAGACALLLLTALPGSASGEVGVVSTCPTPLNAGGFGSAGPSPHTQPVTFDVRVDRMVPQRLEARMTSPNEFEITMSGHGAPAPAGGCGSISLNPVSPGRYEVRLYAVRDGQAATLVQRRSIDLGATASSPAPPPPAPPPPATIVPPPPSEFAPTQSVGEIAFEHSASLDGAAQVSIPIFTPPGRHGVQPSLALTYTSRGANGPLGVGWSVSGLSVISSCRRAPASDEAYGGTYPDRLCLDGARLVEVARSPESTASYAEYRTETDSYRKVIGRPNGTNPDSLEVHSPDGSIMRYGARAASHSRVAGAAPVCRWGRLETVYDRASQPVSQTMHDEHGGCGGYADQRRAWMLDTVEDRFGNRMEIDYDSSEPLLPVEIRYTYHASAPRTKSIRFEYETRPDIRRMSMGGVSYTAAKRLKRIDVVAPLGLSQAPSSQGVLHRYEFTYDLHPVTVQSTLTRVTKCAPGGGCLSPLQFSYSGIGPPVYADKLLIPRALMPLPWLDGFRGYRAADVNGDGFDDVLYRKAQGWSYRLSDGVTLGTEHNFGVWPLLDDADLGMSLVNLDRNQTVDALVPLGGAGYAIARGSGGPLQVSPLPTSIFTPSTGTAGAAAGVAASRVVAVADFNGDTLPDLAVRHACRDARALDPAAAVAPSYGVYNACRWGVALNKSTSSGVDFTSAMDFRWAPGPCAETGGTAGVRWHGSVNAYGNCAEAPQGDPAFVLDVDGNGENELLAPVRRGPNEEFFRRPDSSLELKALGFPLYNSSTLRGTGLSSRKMSRLFLDVNGDGLPDAVGIDGGQVSTAMNVGGTFAAPQAVSVSPAAAAALSLPNEARVGDFNDDGLEDIYLVSVRILLQSNGELGFLEKTLLDDRRLPISGGEDSCVTTGCPGFARRKWDQVLDFNGDGLLDILQMRDGAGHLLQRIGPAPALLQKITGGPLQPEIRFDYKPASSPAIHVPGTCTYPQSCLRKGMWLVSETGVKANVSAQTYPAGFNRTLYSYKGGRFDVRGRGWLGFARRVAVDEQTGATTTTTMNNGWTQARRSNFAINRYPGAFRPVQEVTVIDDRKDRSRAGKIHRWTTDYKYQDRFEGPVATSALVETRQTTEEARAQGGAEGPLTPVSSRRSTFDINSYGLVTRETSEAFEGGFTATDTVPPGAKVKRFEIKRTPSPPDQLNWLVRRYDRVAVTSTEPKRAAVPASATEPARPAVPSRTVTRVTDLRWKPGTTTINRITVEPNQAGKRSLNSVTKLDHDPTGNLTTILTTGHSGTKHTKRRTRIAWDALDQTLVRERENPLQHTERFVHYAGLGDLFSSEDANGLTTTIRRDRFGRPREVQPASSAGRRISYELAPGSRLRVTSTLASGEVERRYEDRWGQLVREDESLLRGNAAIVVRTFDRLGRPATETLPHYDEDPTVESAALDYDNLGRLVESSIGRKDPAPVLGQPLFTRDPSRDAETWGYDGLVTEHTNARGVQSRTTNDAAGRVVRSATVEPRTGREIVTRLEYGPFDVPEAVTDPMGHRTVNRYDILGRRVTMSDPSVGTTTAGYNGYGEVVSLRDGAGVTNIERDQLGRPKRERHTAQGTTRETSYMWDTAANGLGQLAESTSPDDINTVFTYDATGHLAKQEWQLPGPNQTPTNYAVETSWDELGRPELLKYPTVGNRRFALRFLYEPTGTFHKVVDETSGRALWTLRQQDATGLALSEQFGDTTTTDRYLDGRKRLKMIETTRSASASGGPVVLQRLAYDYGPGGLIRSRHNVSPKSPQLQSTEDFEYDFLGRLTGWTAYQNSQKSVQDYSYDDLGNLTGLSALSGLGRTATLRYGPSATSPNAGPMAIRELTENGATIEYQYDSTGRQVSGGGRTITWNEFDLPKRIQAASTDLSFMYDTFQNRTVKQSGPSNTTFYIAGLYERRRTAADSTHVFNLVGPAGVFGQMSLKTTGSGPPIEETWYFHPDMLGTPDLATGDGAGGALWKARYEPFGQRRDESAIASPAALPSPSSVGFTGHEADDEVGLINMRGRTYDPLTMRFLTPDPLVDSPLFSQSLNRYSYVYNNPVNFTDPTGFQCAGNPDACIEQPGGSSGGAGGGGSGGGGAGLGGGTPLNDPNYLCHFNPTDCTTPGTTVGGTTQQTPTREDQTRRGADAGTGWGASPGTRPGSGTKLRDAVDAFAHAAVGAVREAGGEFSVLFGLENQENFELEMLAWKLGGLQYDPAASEIGANFGDTLVHWADPGPPIHAPPGMVLLYGKGPKVTTVRAARVGQEAHRQIEKVLEGLGWLKEVTLELIPGVIVRKDALRLTKRGAQVVIIKPDTPSGQMAANARKRLMEKAGYETIIILYDPTSAAWRRGSPSYVGPRK